MRSALPFTSLALLVAAPATALAQAPFAPLAPAPQPEPVVPQLPQVDEGISTTTLGLILLGVLLLLVTVGYLIMRDARRARPVDPRASAAGGFGGVREDETAADGRPGAAARARARKSREKQKAARRARKVTKRGR